jgi:hypothetical protein
VDTPRLFAKALEKAGGIVDLARSLGIRLSLLGRQEAGKLVAARMQRRRRGLEDLASRGRWNLAPATAGTGRPLDRRRDSAGIRTTDLGEQGAGRWIADGACIAAAVTGNLRGAIDPRGGLKPKRRACFHDRYWTA